MTERKLIKGVTINLGGEDYMVPPLNLEQLEQFAGEVEKLEAATGPTSWGIILTLAQAALSRNYPDITQEKLKQIIDLGNLAALSAAIMGASGLMSPGETTPGE